MIIKNGTLSFVILGDWNSLYTQPEWIAKQLFEQDTIEIGIKGIGNQFSVFYRNNGVTIQPGLNKMVFLADKTNENEISQLCNCVNRFIANVSTPASIKYGINVDLNDEGGLFASKMDDMPDAASLVNSGYEIISTQIKRTLKKSEKIYNITGLIQDGKYTLQINEHHDGVQTIQDFPNITVETIHEFISNCWDIAEALGYEKEGQDE